MVQAEALRHMPISMDLSDPRRLYSNFIRGIRTLSVRIEN
jgi:hypothetical protein